MYKFIYFFKITNPSTYRPVVLITGCSSGIGLALADKLYRLDRYRVIITSREKSLGVLKTNFLENENFKIMELDVAEEESRKRLVKGVKDLYGGVDILVNNAGICYRSVLEEMSYDDEKIQLETNYFGPMSLIRHFLPYMRDKGRGKIINISSVSGMLAMPTMASYSASKHALEGASESLWFELKPFGINVSIIQPGFIRSNSFEKTKLSVRSRLSIELNKPYSDLYHSMIPYVEKRMKQGFATSESIADLVLDVIKTKNPPLWIPASLDAEFFGYLKRYFPRRILNRFLYRLLPNSDHWAERFTHRPQLNFLDKIKTIINQIKWRFYEKHKNRSTTTPKS